MSVVQVKERPILFNGEMVRAVLSGRKTITRREVKKRAALDCLAAGFEPAFLTLPGNADLCPYGQPGERLWVRETYGDAGCRLTYRADLDDGAHCMVKKWTPSIHMPRQACRILLEITDVRVERLHDISEEQARAEGIMDGGCTNCGNHEPCGCDCPSPDAVDSFVRLWKSTGGDWDANPWVWVVEFKRVEA